MRHRTAVYGSYVVGVSKNVIISWIQSADARLRPVVLVLAGIAVAVVVTLAAAIVALDVFVISPRLNDSDAVLRSLERPGTIDSALE